MKYYEYFKSLDVHLMNRLDQKLFHHRPTNIAGHGSAPEVGLTPIDVIAKWYNENHEDSDINNLLCEQES